MKTFFPMRRSEAGVLVFLIAFAAFAFVPAWRTVEVGGMAVFGWLIAALMLISPAVTLVAFRRRRGSGGDGDAAEREAGTGTGAGNGGSGAGNGGSGARHRDPTDDPR